MADVVDRIAPAAAPAKAAEPKSRDALALDAVKVIRRVIEGEGAQGDNVESAIETLKEHFGLDTSSNTSAEDSSQKFDEFDVGEMQEALARARCGQIRDCVIHLGRALPEQFSGIGYALERATENGR